MMQEKPTRQEARQEALFEEIYYAYHDTVLRFLLRLTAGDELLSEELTQETFCQAWTGLERFRGDCALSTWLCQISKNCWLKYLRKHKNAPMAAAPEMLAALTSAADEANCPENCPEDLALQKETQAALRSAILRLPKKQRDVIIYRFYYDLPYEEIERLTGMKKAAARVLCQRGRARLQKTLETELGRPPAP